MYLLLVSFPYFDGLMNANQTHPMKVIKNTPAKDACHPAGLIKLPLMTGRPLALQRSVRIVMNPTTKTTQKVIFSRGIGAVLILKRYRKSAIVHAKTISANPAKNSEKPKILGPLGSKLTKQKKSSQAFVIIDWYKRILSILTDKVHSSS